MTSRIHWAWVILVVSFITIFTNYSIRLSYGILMPEMIVSLQITKAEAGVIASSFYLSYTIFSPLVGFLVDRLSARKLLAFFSLILAGGTFLMHKPNSLFQACSFLRHRRNGLFGHVDSRGYRRATLVRIPATGNGPGDSLD